MSKLRSILVGAVATAPLALASFATGASAADKITLGFMSVLSGTRTRRP